MTRTHRIIAGLSSVAALGALTLSACGKAPAVSGAADAAKAGAPAAAKGPSAARVTSPGAEGEGGVDIAAAATDPVVFGAALAIAEAHVLAARDAYAAGNAEEAASMFAHPVSEVLADMEGAFAARGVVPFNELFIDASAAVLNAESADAIAARTGAIIAALREAEKKAPADRRSAGAVAAGVAADQIDRAVDMYRLAASSGEYGPYLDGYGFYRAAQSAFSRHEAAIAADNPDAADKISAALALLSAAYPDALEGNAPAAEIAALSAASSRVMLATGR